MPKFKSFLSSLLILCAFDLASCTHYYYGPNSANVPLFKEKDEVRLSGAISGADETTGVELQSAYAFGKNFSGIFNFYSAGGSSETSSGSSGNSSIEKGNGTLTEIGLGYFKPLKTTEWIFEIYGGAGGGRVNNSYSQSERSKVGLTRLFLQPSFGYSNEKRTLEAAISVRISNVNFRVKESTVAPGNNNFTYKQIEDVKTNNNIAFIEPSFLFRGGSKNIKVQFQLTSSAPLKQKLFFTQTLNTSLGIVFSFEGKVKE